MFKYLTLIFLISLNVNQSAGPVPKGDRILGKWMAAEKNLIVQVYKDRDEFKAKIVWFKEDPTEPDGGWRDKHNPDPALRSRKILGIDVLNGLKYDAKNDTWDGGTVYDAQHGKQWDAAGYIDKDGLLKVKGYWHFKIFGKTMVFKRV